jgi:hypothetical protein
MVIMKWGNLFIDDVEKISDMLILSKEEFLASYSYLTEDEYDETASAIMEIVSNFSSVAKSVFIR